MDFTQFFKDVVPGGNPPPRSGSSHAGDEQLNFGQLFNSRRETNVSTGPCPVPTLPLGFLAGESSRTWQRTTGLIRTERERLMDSEMAAKSLIEKITLAEAEVFECDNLIKYNEASLKVVKEKRTELRKEMVKWETDVYLSRNSAITLKKKIPQFRALCQQLLSSLQDTNAGIAPLKGRIIEAVSTLRGRSREFRLQQERIREEEAVRFLQQKKLEHEKKEEEGCKVLDNCALALEAKKQLLKEVNQKLRQQLERRPGLEEKNQVCEAETSAARLESQMFQSRISKVRGEFKKIFDDYTVNKSKLDQEMEEVIGKLEGVQVDELEAQVQELEGQKSKAQEELKSLEASCDDISQQIEKTESTLQENRVLCQSVNQTIAELDAPLKELSDKAQLLEDDFDLLSYLFNKLKESDSVDEVIADYRKILNSRQQTIQMDQEQSASELQKIKELEEQVRALRDKILALSTESARKREELATLRESIAGLEAEKQQRLAEEISAADEVAKQLESLQSALREEQAKIAELKTEYDKFQSDLEEISHEKVALKSEKTQLMAQVDKEAEKKEQKAEEKRREEGRQQQKLLSLLGKKEALLQTLQEEKSKKMEIERAELEETQVKTEAERRRSQRRVEQTKRRKEERKRRITTLTGNLDILKNRLAELRNQSSATAGKFKGTGTDRAEAAEIIIPAKAAEASRRKQEGQHQLTQKKTSVAATTPKATTQTSTLAPQAQAVRDICAESPVLSRKFSRTYATRRLTERSPYSTPRRSSR